MKGNKAKITGKSRHVPLLKEGIENEKESIILGWVLG